MDRLGEGSSQLLCEFILENHHMGSCIYMSSWTNFDCLTKGETGRFSLLSVTFTLLFLTKNLSFQRWFGENMPGYFQKHIEHAPCLKRLERHVYILYAQKWAFSPHVWILATTICCSSIFSSIFYCIVLIYFYHWSEISFSFSINMY